MRAVLRINYNNFIEMPLSLIVGYTFSSGFVAVDIGKCLIYIGRGDVGVDT